MFGELFSTRPLAITVEIPLRPIIFIKHIQIVNNFFNSLQTT